MSAAAARRADIIGVLCALAGGVLWGFSGSCAQLVFSHNAVSALWVVSVRIIIAACLLMILALALRGRAVLEPLCDVRSVLRIAAYAFMGIAFTQFTYLMTIDYSNAGTATMLEYIGPVLVVLVVCVRDRRRPMRRELIAVACVVAGVFFLATHGDPTQLVLTRQALTWGLLSAISMVFYSMLPEPLLARYDSMSVLAWGFALAAAVLAVSQHPWTVSVALDAASWIALVGGLSVLGTAVAFIVYLQGLKRIGPSRTSMLSSMEVLTATCLSVVWLGSPFTRMDFMGLLCIMATVFLLARPQDCSEKRPVAPALKGAHAGRAHATGSMAPITVTSRR